MQPEIKKQEIKPEKEKSKWEVFGPILNFGGGLLRFIAAVIEKFFK
ncbi:hypothetical protein [Bacillus cereus group sp. BceL293]